MNSNWKGGRGIDPRGAAWVYVPGSSDGIIKAHTISEYRLIAAKKIGRPLLDNEIVHHIDGDVTNNDFENIQVMTQSEHCSIHTKKLHAEGGISTCFTNPRNSKGQICREENAE